jgi:hypothetical protein
MSRAELIWTKIVESDLCGCGHGRIEYREEHGDSSTLVISVDNSGNTGDDRPEMMRIVGSIEIEEFFKLIDRVRRADA